MDDFEVVLIHLNTSKKTNTTKPPSVFLGFPTQKMINPAKQKPNPAATACSEAA